MSKQAFMSCFRAGLAAKMPASDSRVGLSNLSDSESASVPEMVPKDLRQPPLASVGVKVCTTKQNSDSMKKQPDKGARQEFAHVGVPDQVKIDSDGELTSPGQLGNPPWGGTSGVGGVTCARALAVRHPASVDKTAEGGERGKEGGWIGGKLSQKRARGGLCVSQTPRKWFTEDVWVEEGWARNSLAGTRRKLP
ncbi:MAG: hypothetical protein FRX49_07167 [Trebouxia sp. A1-2]|nr:MAG: hypothetical protein FRX49_07167 [Trebouxia sp. A1-2]